MANQGYRGIFSHEVRLTPWTPTQYFNVWGETWRVRLITLVTTNQLVRRHPEKETTLFRELLNLSKSKRGCNCLWQEKMKRKRRSHFQTFIIIRLSSKWQQKIKCRMRWLFHYFSKFLSSLKWAYYWFKKHTPKNCDFEILWCLNEFFFQVCSFECWRNKFTT